MNVAPLGIGPTNGYVHQTTRGRYRLQGDLPILGDNSQDLHRHPQPRARLPVLGQAEVGHANSRRIDAVEVGRVLVEAEERLHRSANFTGFLKNQSHGSIDRTTPDRGNRQAPAGSFSGLWPRPTQLGMKIEASSKEKAGNPQGFPASETDSNYFPSSWAWVPPAAGAIGCLAK